jgi:zinc/manganese transport system substrate-binding protein
MQVDSVTSRRALLRRCAAAAMFGNVATWASAQDRPRVIASFSILADLVQAVGGDSIDVSAIVGPDQDAHVREPTPSSARAIVGAKAVVLLGLGFDAWMEKLARASGFKGLTIVAGDGVEPVRGHSDHGQHRHRVDPHVWQDPQRTMRIVATITEGLVAIDRDATERYRVRAKAYRAELEELDREIRAAIAAIPEARRKIYTSHDAFGYFANRYGVTFRAPRGVSTDGEPSAADIARLIRQIRQEKVRVVFVENITEPKLIERIAAETGARVGGRLYTDALSGSSGPAPNYLMMMRHNLRLMVDAMTAD